jgi:hypothetical protein
MIELLPHLPWLQTAALFGILALAIGLRIWGGRWGMIAGRVLLGLALLASLAWVGLALREAARLMT